MVNDINDGTKCWALKYFEKCSLPTKHLNLTLSFCSCPDSDQVAFRNQKKSSWLCKQKVWHHGRKRANDILKGRWGFLSSFYSLIIVLIYLYMMSEGICDQMKWWQQTPPLIIWVKSHMNKELIICWFHPVMSNCVIKRIRFRFGTWVSFKLE
jgi:hypothetical protein